MRIAQEQSKPCGSFQAPAPGAAQFVPTLGTTLPAPLFPPVRGWSQPRNNRGQKRQADVELHRDKNSLGGDVEADLFLIENCLTCSPSYVVPEYQIIAKYRPDDWDILVDLLFKSFRGISIGRPLGIDRCAEVGTRLGENRSTGEAWKLSPNLMSAWSHAHCYRPHHP